MGATPSNDKKNSAVSSRLAGGFWEKTGCILKTMDAKSEGILKCRNSTGATQKLQDIWPPPSNIWWILTSFDQSALAITQQYHNRHKRYQP